MTQVITGGFKKAPPKPRIDEGEYSACILSAMEVYSFGPKVLIRFSIAYEGGSVILPLFCNVKLDPDTNERLEPGLSSKLARVLRRLFPGRPLSEMNLEHLAGLPCRVKVVNSSRDGDRVEKPDCEWYSVVSDVVQRLYNPPPEDCDIPF